ncbi:ABC transporter substrate-binding protein [Bacillaceae bacterium C204]|uniref:ABC transporter substrate-binding protein n=1 Tax=Neobacillus sp. 204 TaxID=3383351 RepID=UPI00397E22E7
MGLGNRFKLIALSTALLSSLVLGACSNKASGDEANVIKVPNADIWGEESSALKVMYDLYQKDHPKIKLKQVTVKEMGTALAAGEAPDLILQGPFEAEEAYKQGYIEPLNKYYEKYKYDKDMFGWAKNSYLFNGKYIGIPWNYEGLMLVYNKTMFDKNGWKVPTNYNEVTALVKQMESKSIIPFAWGTSDCAGCDDWWVSSMVNSVLGKEGAKQLFSGDKKWTDPKIVEAVQRYSDFWNEGHVTNKKSQAISQTDATQLFITGKAAMKLDGTWSLASDLKTDFEVGYAPFPSWAPDGKPIIPLGIGGGFTINAKSKHKKEVAELLSYFFHKEVVQAMAKNGIVEPIKADYSGMNFRPNVKEALDLINEAAAKGESGYQTYSYASPSVVEVLENDFASVYLKKTSVIDWLKKLQKQKEKDAKDGTLYKLENY